MGWWKESIDIVKKNDPAARTSLVSFGAFGLKLRFTQGLRLLKVSSLTMALALLLVRQLLWRRVLCFTTVSL